MKIFAIGRNYSAHARELNNTIPEEPVVFIKPQSALLKNDMPFDMPQFSEHVDYETELVIRICRNGKNISLEKASEYYRDLTVGIDFTARDIQNKCKENGLPWELAKAFDHSAAIGNFIPLKKVKDLNNLNFHLNKNQKTVQSGNSKDMLFNIDYIISFISKYFTLNIGDLIFTGTPEGVGKVNDGDLLEAFIENERLLHCEVKDTVKANELKRKRSFKEKSKSAE